MFTNRMKDQTYLYEMLFELNKLFDKKICLDLTTTFIDFGAIATFKQDENKILINQNQADGYTLIHEYSHSFSPRHDLKFLLFQSYIQYHFYGKINFSDYDKYQDDEINFIYFCERSFKKLIFNIYQSHGNDFYEIKHIFQVICSYLYEGKAVDSFGFSGTIYSPIEPPNHIAQVYPSPQ